MIFEQRFWLTQIVRSLLLSARYRYEWFHWTRFWSCSDDRADNRRVDKLKRLMARRWQQPPKCNSLLTKSTTSYQKKSKKWWRKQKKAAKVWKMKWKATFYKIGRCSRSFLTILTKANVVDSWLLFESKRMICKRLPQLKVAVSKKRCSEKYGSKSTKKSDRKSKQSVIENAVDGIELM